MRNTAAATLNTPSRLAGESWKQKFKKIRYNYWLYIMIAFPMIFFVLFRYFPMVNIVMAFKNYNMFLGVWDSPWQEDLLFQFKRAFGDMQFLRALRNTITLNLLDLAVGFPAPIILAILLNEIAFRKFKRFSQTVLYMPHFLSWIIIAGMARQIFAPETGIINIFLRSIGLQTIPFLTDGPHWVFTYVMMGMWQSAGFGTIIFLAAITGINPELYEAAEVDGAGRLRKIWNVTLPGIRPTIVILLILRMGQILAIGFDRPYSFGNVAVRTHADVISTFVYRVGIEGSQFAFATAVGLFQSVICVIFLLTANFIARRLGERGLF